MENMLPKILAYQLFGRGESLILTLRGQLAMILWNAGGVLRSNFQLHSMKFLVSRIINKTPRLSQACHSMIGRLKKNLLNHNIDFKNKLKSEGDSRSLLLPIVIYIQKQLSDVRIRLKNQTKGTRQARHVAAVTADDIASEKFKRRVRQGYKRPRDEEEFMKGDADKLVENLVGKEYPKDAAKIIAEAVLYNKRKVQFVTADIEDSDAFFKVEYHHGGLTVVVFNSSHSVCKQLMESLEPKY